MKARKVLLTVHLYVGLAIGFFLASSGLTGSILVWRNEIDLLLHPELLRVQPRGERLPIQAVVDAAAAASPESVLSVVQLPRSPGESVEITTAGEMPRQIYLDPYTGTVLGSRGVEETFSNALFAWHNSLLSGQVGEWIVGTVALLLLVLVISGLVVWWRGLKRLKQALMVAWSANWKRVNFDVHRALGFWTSLFLLVVAITGSSLIFHDAYMAGLNRLTASPPRPVPAPLTTFMDDPSVPLDSLIALANARLPAGDVTYLTLPASSSAALVVRKKHQTELHPSGRNFIYVHPRTGEVLAVENALEAPLGSRSYNVLYPIHIGRWAGTASRILHSILGLVPLVLLATGFLMWRNRQRRPRKLAGESPNSGSLLRM